MREQGNGGATFLQDLSPLTSRVIVTYITLHCALPLCDVFLSSSSSNSETEEVGGGGGGKRISSLVDAFKKDPCQVFFCAGRGVNTRDIPWLLCSPTSILNPLVPFLNNPCRTLMKPHQKTTEKHKHLSYTKRFLLPAFGTGGPELISSPHYSACVGR